MINDCSLAIEELPKHKSYKGFASAEKTKAEALLHKAIENAEQLKVRLKSVFDDDAKRARAQFEQEKMQQEAMLVRRFNFFSFKIHCRSLSLC